MPHHVTEQCVWGMRAVGAVDDCNDTAVMDWRWLCLGDLAVVGCMLESDIEYSVALDQALKVVPGLVGASALVNLNEGTFESMLPAGAQIKGIIPNESRCRNASSHSPHNATLP
jgi:hypothetical protein